ncbi:MAG: hypothetical protein OXT74_11115 [Candidatus Poribacteria bacterium]|nr:hypothetical protein [Candidatus Poribacteria bacterium]
MKTVLLFAIPIALVLTLTIAITAYAWTVDANARCLRVGNNGNGYTSASGAAYASGLEEMDLDAEAKVGDILQWDAIDDAEGSAWLMCFEIGGWEKDATASANAGGWLIHNEGEIDEWKEWKSDGERRNLPVPR